MALGVKTGGRQKGTPNKMTSAAKEAFALAFDSVGGSEALAEWARENRTEFYRLYSKLIPIDTQVSGPDGGPVSMSLAVELVESSRTDTEEAPAAI